MKRLLGGIVVAVTLLVPASASADRSFTARYSTNDTGDITIAANTLMTCPAAAANCTRARAADPTLPDSALQNNAYAMEYVDTDGTTGIGATTFNSSTSQLNLPAGATVLFAGLYWGGDTSGSGANAAPNAAARNTALFRPPGAAGYTSLTATTLDDSTQAGRYQSFRDVTSIVAAAGAGTYTTANVQAGRGTDHYAGWSLVVVYHDPSQPPRNLTVFDGLRTVSGTTGQTIPVSGFQTPPSGPVNTKVGFVAYEGDLGIPGDSANLNGTTLSDAQNPATNFFNSSISNTGTRVSSKNPDYPNQLGYDADIVNANGILANNATSANIGLTTSGDVYIPGVITFATELFAPKIDQTKTVVDINGGNVEQGDVLEYRINGTNNGQDGAVGFVLRDPIPANTTYVAGSIQTANPGVLANRTDASGDDVAEFDSPNNRVVGRLGIGATSAAGGRIAPGASYEMRFRVRVNSAVPAGTQIDNTATANFFSQSLNTPLAVSSSASVVTRAPDLAITKTRNGGPFVPGGSGSYNLAIANVGNASLQGGLTTPPTTTVTDTLPASLTPTGASGAGWTCNVVAQTVTCTRANNLAIGASFPAITINVNVDPGATPPIINTATVSNPVDTNPANDTSIDPSPVSPSADLSIVKTASSPTVNVGQNVTYTLTVRNDGPSLARNVAVTDTLPNGLSLVSVNPSQGSCDNVISCDLGNLAPGATATVTVIATATAAGAGTSVTNTATVSGDQPDPDPTDNESSTAVDVSGADLEIEKVISDSTPTAGQAITYTLTLTNNGPSGATGVAVHDTVPDFLTGISTDRPECTVAGRDVDCSFASLASGASQTIVISATVPASQPAGGLDNTASVNAAEPDPDPTNNTDTATATVDDAADLSITKTASANPVPAGELLTYTLTITNDGPSDAANVEITDDLPAGVTFDSASPGCSEAGGTVTCTIAPLPAGATVNRTVTVRVDDTTVGTLVNNAEVTSDTPDPDPTDNETTVTTDVQSGADLETTKTVSPNPATPGSLVTYTLTVTNNGAEDADDVMLTDTLPPGVTFVSSTPGAPDCQFAGGSLACDLGTIPAGDTRIVTVQATVDAASLPADHQHLVPVEKVEQQVDLESGETRTLTLSCPIPGQVMVDANVRVDAVDQGTGTLPDVQYSRMQSTSLGSYDFVVTNTSDGRAQAKLFGVCIPDRTAVEAGHSHDIIVSDPPITTTAPLTTGRHELNLTCGAGRTAVSPGIDVSGGNARLVASEPTADGGRRFVVEVVDDAALVTVSVRCLLNQVGVTDGHSHPLQLQEVVRTVSVSANSTVNESVICPDDAKGIVASYDLPPGIFLAGNDPQPKSRVFKLVNTTGAAISVDLDLLCLGDRTGGAILASQIVNSATASSSTLDPDSANNTDSASLAVGSGPAPPPPPGPQPQPLAPADPNGGASAGGAPTLDDGPATLGADGVEIPVSCSGSECSGSVTLRAVKSKRAIHVGDKLGASDFSLPEGSSTVDVALKKAAAKLAATGKLTRVKAVLRYIDGDSTQRAKRIFKLRRS